MYPNLKQALQDRDIIYQDIANLLGVSKNTVGNKISGHIEFTTSESIKIFDRYFSSDSFLDFCTLFEKEPYYLDELK